MVKFESYKIPQGINNQTTQLLTVKSIRRLRSDEHKMVNYDFNSPYEVKIEEEVVYDPNANIVPDADVFYYFVDNLGKKVQIPLRNKYVDQYGQSIYSVRSEEEVVNCINQGKVKYQNLEEKKLAHQEIKGEDNKDEQEKTLDIRSNGKIDQVKLNIYKTSKSNLDAIKRIISSTLEVDDGELNVEHRTSIDDNSKYPEEGKKEEFQNYSEGSNSKFKIHEEKITDDHQSKLTVFESYKIPWGVNDETKRSTGELTIKGIRRLEYREHGFGEDYDSINPIYRVDVEEDVIYEEEKSVVVSHFIRFFAHADCVDVKPAMINNDAPIFYYFVDEKEVLDSIGQEKKKWDDLGYTEREDLVQKNKKLVDREVPKVNAHESNESLEISIMIAPVMPPELNKKKDEFKEDYSWKAEKLPSRLININDAEQSVANDRIENIKAEKTEDHSDIKNYAILSYVWGETKENEKISQGGKKALVKAIEACSGEYASEDKVSLSLSQALRAIRNRGRSVAIDGIYSILGLLPYGNQVAINYSIDPKDALHNVMKVATQRGYGEPLAWHGLGSQLSGLC
ncbi:7136_t:CDS:2 [Ambispora gerdemannii]|uniref:7136_t:CDS:1 n=1 Tax=Ambispora gerdemannii TaxID=144530 RepID=A0A9N8ZYP5_9GLOM|nr:7136_t:CDS:2 [Ambispora gerdemannii]